MSLQINVIVGPRSLVDQNSSQIEGRRFQYTEKNEQYRTIQDIYGETQIVKEITVIKREGDYVRRQPTWIKQKPAAFRFGISLAHCLNTFTGETTSANSLFVQPYNYSYSIVAPGVPTVSWNTSWTVQSIDETASVSGTLPISSISSVPSPTLNYTIYHPTGQVIRTVITYDLARYYTGGYVQFLGTVINISISGNGINLTPSIIEQAGGIDGVSEEDVITNGPPVIEELLGPFVYTSVGPVEGTYTNTSSYVTVTIDYQYDLSWSNDAISSYSNNSNNAIIILPCRKNVCILIQLARHSHKLVYKSLSGVMHDVSPSYIPTSFLLPTSAVDAATPITTANYGTTTVKAYLCSFNTVRELTIPSTLQGILDIMNPPITDAENPGTISSLPSDPAIGFLQGYGNTQTWTPSVFAALNEINEFIPASQIKTFSPSKRPITPDFRYGYYAYSETDPSLYYAEWLGDPTYVDAEQLNLLINKPSATVRLTNSMVDNLPSTGLHSVWNWEDPAYCTTMLTALGFTESDLKPTLP